MTYPPLDPRCVHIPLEHRKYAANVLHTLGPRKAAKLLGVGKNTVLNIVATGECLPGTAALLREAVARKEWPPAT